MVDATHSFSIFGALFLMRSPNYLHRLCRLMSLHKLTEQNRL